MADEFLDWSYADSAVRFLVYDPGVGSGGTSESRGSFASIVIVVYPYDESGDVDVVVLGVGVSGVA